MLKSSARKNVHSYKFTEENVTEGVSGTNDNNVEKNEQSSDVRGGEDSAFGVYNIIMYIVTAIAVLASLKRNKGLDWSILAAFFLSPFYIIYCIAVPHKGVRIWSMPI